MTRCATVAMTTLAMIATGASGGLAFMMAVSQTGAVPPGEGRISTAAPPQTKDMPSVTTMAGRPRASISAPSAA